MATTFLNLLRLTLLFSVWSIFEKVPYVINMKVQLLDAFFFFLTGLCSVIGFHTSVLSG